jgi:hypothetical protein
LTVKSGSPIWPLRSLVPVTATPPIRSRASLPRAVRPWRVPHSGGWIQTLRAPVRTEGRPTRWGAPDLRRSKASLCELHRGTQASAESARHGSSAINDAGRPAERVITQRSSVASRCTAKQPPRGAMCLAARSTYLWSAASLEIPSSVRTVAPAARPVTAPWSAVAASASGNVAPTWSDSSPSASAATRTASRAPSART